MIEAARSQFDETTVDIEVKEGFHVGTANLFNEERDISAGRQGIKAPADSAARVAEGQQGAVPRDPHRVRYITTTRRALAPGKRSCGRLAACHVRLKYLVSSRGQLFS